MRKTCGKPLKIAPGTDLLGSQPLPRRKNNEISAALQYNRPMNTALHPGAIQANRRGRLAPAQAAGLAGWVLFGACLFAPGAAMFGWFCYSVLTQRLTGAGPILVNAIFNVGFAAALMVFGYLLGGRLLIDILQGRVMQVEGQGMKYSGAGSSSGAVYYYAVGQQNFQIPSYGTYKKLHYAGAVRAYYLPRSKTLVNVEPIASPFDRSANLPKEAAADPQLSELWKLMQAEKRAKQTKDEE